MDEELVVKDRFTLESVILTLPDTSERQTLTEDEIDAILTKVPQMKLAQNVRILNLQAALKDAVAELKKVKAVYTLQANQNRGKPGMATTEGRSAWVDLKPDVEQAQKLVNDLESELAMAKVIEEYLQDSFLTARKMAVKIEAQYKIEMEVAKYNKPLY